MINVGIPRHVRCAASGLAMAVAFGLVSCQGGDAGPGEEHGSPARLEIVGGDGQAGTVGQALAIPPTVAVRDSAGDGIPGVEVTFTVVKGGGAVDPGVVITGADGRASATGWTLGTSVGENTLRAVARRLPDAIVEFTARSTPGPVDPARSVISAVPGSVPTGTPSAVTVTIADAFGNPIPDQAVSLSATGTGNIIVQPAPTSAEGISVGSLRSSVAGIKTISAEADGLTLAQEATITVEGPPVVASVAVTPSEAALLVGVTTKLSATVLDDQGRPLEDEPVEWQSSDAAVATVSREGLVTARGPGSATIRATAGGISGSAKITVSLGEGTLIGLTYCTIGGVGDKMDVYVPDALKPRPLPVAVHVHGGGWVGGSRSSGEQFAAVKETLLERGYLVVSLDYRLAPAHKYPSQIQDVRCAVRHLRARASRYGLDPDRIGAWGGSAGGQLVALLGTAGTVVDFDDGGGFPEESSRVQAVVAISAITDLTHLEDLSADYSREFPTWPDPTSAEMIEASPITHVTNDDPPFFFILGEDDALVSPAQSARMHQRLLDAGVSSSLLTVLHADHDLKPTTAPTDPSSAVIVSRIAGFFDRHLR